MKQRENTWARYRNVRLASAVLGMLLAFLAMVFPAHSLVGRAFLLASLAVTALILLVLTRRPGHQPNAVEILLPLATLGIVAWIVLRIWR